MAIHAKNLSDANPASKIVVARPSRFRRSWYRALAALGLRRSSAGGFGAVIPESTAG